MQLKTKKLLYKSNQQLQKQQQQLVGLLIDM